MSAPDVDIVRDKLETIYGSGSMTTALASDIVDSWEAWEYEEARHEYARPVVDSLHLYIWNWFAGGSTAELAAQRIVAAVEQAKQ